MPSPSDASIRHALTEDERDGIRLAAQSAFRKLRHLYAAPSAATISQRLALLILGITASACHLIRPSVPPCEQLKLWLDAIDGARISAACVSPNSIRIDIENNSQDQPLRGFSVDFCGTPVRSTHEPNRDWIVEVSNPPENTMISWLFNPIPRTTIEWRLEREDHHLEPGRGVEGFVVQLGPEWQPGHSLAVQWQSGLSFVQTSHDCV
jgi:hypothetical protein